MLSVDDNHFHVFQFLSTSWMNFEIFLPEIKIGCDLFFDIPFCFVRKTGVALFCL